jgi:hypothetical protein
MAGNLERLQRAAAALAASSSSSSSAAAAASAATAAADDDDNDGGGVGLSAAAREALLAVLAETAEASSRASREADISATGLALATSEDWQLSQFWYSEETARGLGELVRSLAREAVAGAPPRAAVVAFLSCPSAFKALRAILAEEDAGQGEGELRSHILEYDKRFAVFGDAFSFYDYASPLALPPALVGACDVVVLDPPFLNRDCLAEFARSVSALRAAGGASRVVLCTGAVMLQAARDLLGARPTRAEVRHSSGRLSNPFCVFVDFEVEESHPFLCGIDVEAERAVTEREAPLK